MVPTIVNRATSIGRFSIISIALLVWWTLPALGTPQKQLCPRQINVAWQQQMPYVGMDATAGNRTQLEGVVGWGFHDLLKHCCGNQTDITYTELDMSNSSARFADSDANVYIPVSKARLQLDAFGGDLGLSGYVPLVQSSGVVYLIQSSQAEGDYAIICTVFQDVWPFVVMLILAACYGGLIIWLLECFWNRGEFPSSCPRGVWEGIWWSIVTMTTLGYGDRTPRTILGRLFGMLYVMFGIIVITLFTASVTSAVSHDTGKPHISGKMIAVLKHSPEFHLLIVKGSRPREYAGVLEFSEAMRNVKALHGGLIEATQWDFHGATNNLAEELKILAEYEFEAYYGLVLGDGWSRESHQCMSKRAFLQEPFLHSTMKRAFQSSQVHDRRTRDISHAMRQVFSLTNTSMMATLSLMGLWMAIMMITSGAQCLYYHSKRWPLRDLCCTCMSSSERSVKRAPET